MTGADDDLMTIGESMGTVLRSLEGGRRGAAGVAAVGGVFGRWTEVVGEAMARHVQPVRLDGDRLLVEVSEPAWATQVRLLSDGIRARVAAVCGAQVEVLDVRVTGSGGRRR